MRTEISGWKKVYLFYGVLCFSLGLLGFFFNNGLRLPRLARLALMNVSRELSALGLVPSETSREVTVSNPRFHSIIYVDGIGNSRYAGLKEGIRYRLQARSYVISYPVSEREWYKTPRFEGLLSNGRFLVGLDLETGGEGMEGPSILFSLERLMTVEFINRLINCQPEIPLFKLELISRGQTYLYRFGFEDPHSSSGHLMKVIDILLDLWETGGPNLQRGNYRETFH